ncbi:MAG TPA: DctP family TRAP transporter solute-binding subunit [Candidatus Methylomirabilis sp.]|nr:DctP family TRAP transporter solute-binding subunit [Candidatus Methylomirabilis sp.]
MRTRVIIFMAVVVLAAAWMGLGAAEAAYKPEFKASLVVGPSGPWGESAARFSDLLKERTQGRINVKPYYAGQLFAGKQTNEFTLLNQGVADFAFGSTINWSPQVHQLNLFTMPFLVPSYRSQDAIQVGEPGKKILQLIEAKGVIPLAWGENGFRQLTNSKRAVKSPADLDGLKIRVVGSPIFIDTFRALGANPVNMNWGEAQTAFQQGTVDGQENPIVSVIIPSKLWTSQKHITLWNYVNDPLILGMSKLTWDSLSAEDKAIVKKTAEEVMAWQKQGARAGLENSTEAVEMLKKNGMEVSTLTAKDVEAFKAKTKAVYEKWTTEIGADLVKGTEKIVAETK